jgi:hypothetical protein
MNERTEIRAWMCEGIADKNATRLIGEAHVSAHNLQHAAVDVLVCDAFDVAISNLLVPDLQRLGSIRMF